MQRWFKKFGMCLGLLLLLSSVTACEPRNPAVLKNEKWTLTVITPQKRLLGRTSFTTNQIKIQSTTGSRISWMYYFNSDDDLVIQTGRYAGTYVLKNNARDFQLVPIKDATQTLEIQRLKK
ncbi:hypothetical protein ACFQH1_10925 [Lactiplantibacillus daoliensis]|uniref:Lipoprotein n=1 Tax=Lactiplantibacillus daoliensis TaxID=2559916 RepID=A0ABW1UIP6_9LACO|nr:hypothetical protein [Lactiplantibacillus daoliensis]